MDTRKIPIVLVLIMIGVVLIVTGSALYIIYRTAIEEEGARLMETARSQARLMEAVARFNTAHQKKWHPHVGIPAEGTLGQIEDAHRNYRGFGKTGEFAIAHRNGELIIFDFCHRRGFGNHQRALDPDIFRGNRCCLRISERVHVGYRSEYL